MATLTTLTGLQIEFAPSAVTAVCDHNPDTGEAITCVYGLEASFVRIAETVTGFLSRIGAATTFAQLTRPDGNPVWINAVAVGSIRAADRSLGDSPNAGAVISVGSVPQSVTERLAATANALNQIRAAAGVQPL